jgi:hypothetical protein
MMLLSVTNVCGTVAMLCAVVAGQTPSLNTDGTNIQLSALGGDVMVGCLPE